MKEQTQSLYLSYSGAFYKLWIHCFVKLVKCGLQKSSYSWCQTNIFRFLYLKFQKTWCHMMTSVIDCSCSYGASCLLTLALAPQLSIIIESAWRNRDLFALGSSQFLSCCKILTLAVPCLNIWHFLTVCQGLVRLLSLYFGERKCCEPDLVLWW